MDESKKTPEEAVLSRRELLKALAAAGGALGAAAFLPGKWTKPLVEAGVLPAHAQGTMLPNPTVDLYSVSQVSEFNYNDPAGEWDADALLWAWVNGGVLKAQSAGNGICYVHEGKKIGSVGGYSGDGYTGYAWFNTLMNCTITNASQLCIQVEVKGRPSNTDCEPLKFNGTIK
jgi:hypothetical protein